MSAKSRSEAPHAKTAESKADGFRFDIAAPVNGWATIRLTAPNVALEFAASYTPRDSIGDFASAASGLLAELGEQVVVWNTEPVEFEFRFVTVGDGTRLRVYKFPDFRRHWRRAEVPVAVIEDETTAIARVLWQGLRRLQGMMSAEEFASAWRHPFPIGIVDRLGNQLRSKS